MLCAQEGSKADSGLSTYIWVWMGGLLTKRAARQGTHLWRKICMSFILEMLILRCLPGITEKVSSWLFKNSYIMFMKVFGLDFKYLVEENRFLTILLRTEGLEILASFRWKAATQLPEGHVSNIHVGCWLVRLAGNGSYSL